MCTLMQKDVLIELVAKTRSTISLRSAPDSPRNDDQAFLSTLRNDIYRTHHDKLDFEKIAAQVKAIKAKYEHQPVNQMYL